MDPEASASADLMGQAPDLMKLPAAQLEAYLGFVSSKHGPGFHRSPDGVFVHDHSTTLYGWKDRTKTDLIVCCGGSYQGEEQPSETVYISPEGVIRPSA